MTRLCLLWLTGCGGPPGPGGTRTPAIPGNPAAVPITVTGTRDDTSEPVVTWPDLWRCPQHYTMDQMKVVGHIHLDVSEYASFSSPELNISFGVATGLEDFTRVGDPLLGPDDCVVFAPYSVHARGDERTVGPVTWAIGAEAGVVEPEPWEFYGLEGYGYDIVYFEDLPEPITVAALWGQALSVSAPGGDGLPAFDLLDAVTFPAGPIELTSPRETPYVWDTLLPEELVFRWTPGQPGSPLMKVILTPFGQNGPEEANKIDCWVEDDGEWAPPPEIWDWITVYPQQLSYELRREDVCYFEVGPDQFIQVGVDIGLSQSVFISP